MSFDTKPGLMEAIRERFAHVDRCPFQGERIFFENAGGALTLKSVAETSAVYAAIPDNQGRANVASAHLNKVIAEAKDAAMIFLGAESGEIIVGESGTEMIFRLIRTAILGTAEGGSVLGTTLEHPATRSAAIRYAEITGKDYIAVRHDDATGSVTAEAYAAMVRPDTRVATIIHTSPVTGMGVDIAAVAKAIRAVSPDCYIIVDGIQHAAHGHIDIDRYNIDGYAISPYKMFSRHGYGIGWLSERLAGLPRDTLIGGPGSWELGTRDTGSYATLHDVIRYMEWLGGQFTDGTDPRDKFEAAGAAIHAHEAALTRAMLHGTGNLKGLAEMPDVRIIGGVENPLREGLVACWVEGRDTAQIIAALNERGIRCHIRKADHYSGNVLEPLGREDCIRVSMCHYNRVQEVAQFLAAMQEIVDG